MPSTFQSIDINVSCRSVLEERLEAAVSVLQEAAMLTGASGILVTRHSPQNFTVELSEQVPFGLTRELIH